MGRIYDKARFKLRTYVGQLNMLFTMGEELEAKVDGEGIDFKTINGESLKGEGDIELQTPLESGVNIKTINGQSITGAGDLVVGESGTIAIDGELSTSSENPVQNKVITTALNGKQDTIPAGTYTTPSDVSTAIADKVTTTQLDAALADKVTTAQLNSAVSDKVTTTQLDTALADKQDTLIPGSGITIVNNVISSTGGGDTPVDVYTKQETNALLDGKQDVLISSQLAAVNSGITANRVSTYDGYSTGKQDKLTTTQLSAVNSGITQNKRVQYDNYASNKQDKLTAGTGIAINSNNVISVTSSGQYEFYSIKSTADNIFGSNSHTVTIYFEEEYAVAPLVLFSEMRKNTSLPNHHVYIYEITTDHVTFRAGGSEFNGLQVMVVPISLVNVLFPTPSSSSSTARPMWTQEMP